MISIIAALIFGSIGAVLAAFKPVELTPIELAQLAKKDDVEAQFNLGGIYFEGRGVQKDYKTAAKWYRLAAELGLAKAQNNLGGMCSEGLGVNQDYKTAVKWYALAAEQGLANAQYNLGRMYSLGQGVNQDDKQAAEWVTRAAEQGHAEAQLVLGGMYFEGQGISQDYVTAHMWVNMASMNGDKIAPELQGLIAKEMTPAQIHAAQKRAKDCVAKNYKDC